MESSIFKATVAVAFSVPSSALPLSNQNVTISLLPNTCSSYPNYNNATGIAGPWLPAADSTGNNAIDGLKLSAEVFTNDGKDHYGFVTLPNGVSNPYGQNITFRCVNSTLQAQMDLGGGAGISWENLSIPTSDNWQAQFGFNVSPSISVAPYAHFIGGVRQPGVFLGAGNSTTWKFKHIWGGVVGDYFLLRLLGTDGNAYYRRVKRQIVVDDTDYVGFLKITG